MNKMNNITFGALGEKHAVKFLKKKKYKILEKNYKTKLGEIDIIAEKDGYIVFTEVKSRSADPLLSGVYAVDRNKQRHIIRTASFYLKQNDCELQPRFDIIEIEIDRNNSKVISYNHIENAFIWEGGYAPF